MEDYTVLPYGDISQPSFEGAVTDYRRDLTGIVNGSSDTNAARELLILQLRSASAIRNNGYAKVALSRYVENLKALHITWQDKNGKKHNQMQDLWDEWAENPMLDGVGSFDNWQTLLHTSQFISGAHFTRYQIRKTGNSNRIPLKLEPIQTEYHDPLYMGYETSKDIRYGIEFVDSKPLAYYFLKSRYDSSFAFRDKSYDYIRIPAKELLHVFKRTYPGQWLGIPEMTPVLIDLYSLDDLGDATISKQKAAQAISWIVKSANTMSIAPVGTVRTEKDKDSNDKIVFKANGGNVQYLNKGEDIAFYQSTDIGSNLLPFIQNELRKIAASLDIPYFQFTGDYSGIDFSTLRGISIELRNRIEYIHHFSTIPLAIKPVTSKFKEFAQFKVKKIESIKPVFQLPRWYGVDELKDAQADVLEIQNGMSTLEAKLKERHTTFEEVIADRERIREIGLDNLLFPNGNPMAQANNTQANSNSTGNA